MIKELFFPGCCSSFQNPLKIAIVFKSAKSKNIEWWDKTPLNIISHNCRKSGIIVWNILKSKNVHMCYCWFLALYLEATFFDNGLHSDSALIRHYQIFWRPNKDKMSCLARVNWKNPVQSYVWEYSMLYEIIKGFKTNLMQVVIIFRLHF